GPTTRGFDRFMGFHHAREMATWMVDDRVTENIHVNQMLPRITEASVAYLETRAAKKDGPFFLYVPLSSPHTPIVPVEPWIGKSGLNAYADFVMQTDDTVVRVLDALDETGLDENTIVVFSSDNGTTPRAKIDELRAMGHDPLAGLRGHKADIWEGGHRVPFVVRWPGVVEAGSVSDEPICQTSLLATLAALFDVALKPDQGVDSFSILPVLRGERIDAPTHPAIVHHSFPGKFAIRVGDWKYIACKNAGGWSKGGDGKPFQLYNLAVDRGETANLIDEEPDVAERLRLKLEKLIADGRSTPGPVQSNDVPVQYP
ncbi:MAG: sulfatase-like hydrolase/transferase, partial [Phycisphaeraceae bacterium]